jgi:Protein of unknown function (DUF4031)
MAVYVDDMNAKFGRMLMCHLIADSTDELLAMVDKIGVQRKWIQNPGTWQEHFDIPLSKKKSAIQEGAIEIECGIVVGEMLEQRKKGEIMKPRRVKARQLST